jgi:hypothetical protein
MAMMTTVSRFCEPTERGSSIPGSAQSDHITHGFQWLVDRIRGLGSVLDSGEGTRVAEIVALAKGLTACQEMLTVLAGVTVTGDPPDGVSGMEGTDDEWPLPNLGWEGISPARTHSREGRRD